MQAVQSKDHNCHASFPRCHAQAAFRRRTFRAASNKPCQRPGVSQRCPVLRAERGIAPEKSSIQRGDPWKFQSKDRKCVRQRQDPNFRTQEDFPDYSSLSDNRISDSSWEELETNSSSLTALDGRHRQRSVSRSGGRIAAPHKSPNWGAPPPASTDWNERRYKNGGDDDIWDRTPAKADGQPRSPYDSDQGLISENSARSRSLQPSTDYRGRQLGGPGRRAATGRPTSFSQRGTPPDPWNEIPQERRPMSKQDKRSVRHRPDSKGSPGTFSNTRGSTANGYSSDRRTPRGEGFQTLAEPWKQMTRGMEAAEMDRKARVRLNIACNKVMLLAFEEFCEAEKTAERMADRQEVLHTFLRKVEDTLLGNEGSMDAINASACLQRLAAACCSTVPVGEALETARHMFQRVILMCLKLEGTFKIQAITVVISSLAKLSLANSILIPIAGSQEAHDIQVLLEGLAVRAWNRVSEPPVPEAQQLSLLVWGYSRLSLDPLNGKLFDLVLQTAEPIIGRFEAQNVSNFLLAFATLEKPLPEEFLEKMAQQAVLKMPNATPQGIGNLLWAFAKLTSTQPLGGDLFRSALSRAQEVMGEFMLQNVANLFWAAVQFQQPLSTKMLNRLAAAALSQIQGANTITIAGLLTSYSKLEGVTGQEPLFLAAIQEVDRRVEQCNAHTLSNLIWTLGTVKTQLPSALLHRLNEAWAEHSLAVLEPIWGQEAGWGQNVSNILWGYSQLRLDPLQGRFFQSILSRLTRDNLSVMLPMNTSSILIAAASMQRMSFTPDFLRSALNQIIADGREQEICNTLWSLSALGLLRPPNLKSMVQQLIDLTKQEPLNAASARQVLMANALLPSQASSGKGELVPQWFLERCIAAIQENMQEPIISGFHSEVSAALEGIGVPHALEFSSPDGLLSIDIVARCGDGKPLAIEVDGEEHFTKLPPYRPLGYTVIRNQLIAAAGFRGVGIPFYDWKSLTTATEKATYITARLAKWGIGPS